MGWHNKAACRGMDTNLFFDEHRINEAKAVCKNCPVILECRKAGAANNEEGVWGGMTFKQRKRVRAGLRKEERLRRQAFDTEAALIRGHPKRIANHGTHAGYNCGCRCDACREGERVYQLRRPTTSTQRAVSR